MWRSVFGFTTMLVLVSLAATFMVRRWAPHRWSNPRIRRAVVTLPFVGLGALALWIVFRITLRSAWIIDWLSATVSGVILLETALLLSMPLYGLLRFVAGWFGRGADAPEEIEAAPSVPGSTSDDIPEPDADDEAGVPAPAPAPTTAPSMTRRALLGTAAAAPVAMGALAMGGLAASRMTARVEEKPFLYDNLPPALDGLRILHLSDIHIGLSFSLRDLEGVLEAADAQSPDLVVVTGDLSDRIPELPDALSLIADLKPRYGAFASVGNHEYWRGIDDVRRAHDRSEVPMLLEGSHTFDIRNDAGRASLFLAGADDPRRMRGNLGGFLESTVANALDGKPSDAFTVLMSHRPRGFDAAAKHGVELTLAGHTHGGQMGLFGRSLFDSIAEERYMWGRYTRGRSQLYTSSGVGHWFPWRVGCPTEAPLIVLGQSR